MTLADGAKLGWARHPSPSLSHKTEHGGPQVTFYWAAQGPLAIIVQVRSLFL